ncbi:DUF4340 domain-containing protein [Acidihalobacter prosperus]
MKSSLMLKRWLLNLGLLSTTIILGGFVWHANRANNSVHGQVLMPDLNPSSIKRITISRGHKPKLVFYKSADGWLISSPIKARANLLLIQTLLALPQDRSQRQFSVKDKKLKEYGLNPPKAIVSFDKKHTLLLGNINSINKMRYVLLNKKMHLIRNSFGNLAKIPTIKWISLSLLPSHAHIRELKLHNLTLQKNKQIKQLKIKPSTDKLQKQRAVNILKNWQRARAYRITAIKSNNANYSAKGQSTNAVKITLSSGKIYSFRIISTQPNLVLRNKKLGIDYYFPDTIEKELMITAKSSNKP